MLKPKKWNVKNVSHFALEHLRFENLKRFRNLKVVDFRIGNVYKPLKEVHTKST